MDFKENTEKIWLENEAGKIIAYVEFPDLNGVANVMHTVVSHLEDEGQQVSLC